MAAGLSGFRDEVVGSISRDDRHHRRRDEVIVDADARDVSVEFDARGALIDRGEERRSDTEHRDRRADRGQRAVQITSGAEIVVEIFGLEAQVRSEQPFDAAADRPADA